MGSFPHANICNNSVFTLNILIEKRTQRNLETHLAFIVLGKAHDSVCTPAIENNVICRSKFTINKGYHNNSARIKMSNTRLPKPSYSYTNKVRKYSCLSHTLLNIRYEACIHEALKTYVKQCVNTCIEAAIG